MIDATFPLMNLERLLEFTNMAYFNGHTGWRRFHFLRVSGLAGVVDVADAFETGSPRCKRRLLVAILRLLL